MSKKFHRTTERLIIRPLKSSDYLAWKKAYSSMLPQKNKFDSLNMPTTKLTKAKFEGFLKNGKIKRAREEHCAYGVFLKNKNILIGQQKINQTY